MTDYGQSLDDATVRRLILRHVDTSPTRSSASASPAPSTTTSSSTLGTDDVFIATAWWTAFRAAATIAAHPDLRRPRASSTSSRTTRRCSTPRPSAADGGALLPPRRPARREQPTRSPSTCAPRHGLDVDDALVFAPIVAVPRSSLPLRRTRRRAAGRRLRPPERRTQPVRHGAARHRDVGGERRARGGQRPLEVVSVGEPEQFRYRIGERWCARPACSAGTATWTCSRRAHLGVSLMTSPHPSYPPLEMAASGMVVVTNRWGPKDLGTLSTRLVSVRPDARGVAAALARPRSACSPAVIRRSTSPSSVRPLDAAAARAPAGASADAGPSVQPSRRSSTTDGAQQDLEVEHGDQFARYCRS
jgi:hypothetical protein